MKKNNRDMRQKSQDFLLDILATPSPSGWEAEIQKKWLAYVEPFSDELRTDCYGNSYAVLNPHGSPIIAIMGHADEIGFQIQHIDDHGFLYFKTIGGLDHTLARGQRLWVHNAKGKVFGVVGTLAPHMQDKKEGTKETPIHELFIDIGARSLAEAQKLVAIGDPVTFQAGPEPMGKDLLVARGCDNRVGIFAAAEALRLCAKVDKLEPCVMAISTIGEENGLYGARMAGYSSKVDAALVIDVSHATDVPLCDARKHGKYTLGGGPVLSRGSVNHPVMVERLQKVAAKENITIQMNIDPRHSSTDADAVMVQRGGVPVACVGIPNRYMHSPVEMVHMGDLETTAKLCAAFTIDLKRWERFNIPLHDQELSPRPVQG